MNERSIKRRLGSLSIVIALTLFSVWTLAPVVWALISSLLPTMALTQSPPDLALSNFTVSNFSEALKSGPNLGESMLNSLVVALLTMSLALLLGAPAAYGLARLGIRGSQKILLGVLASQMFPAIVIVIPLFIVVSSIGLADTYVALVGANLSLILPIVIWVLKGFFEAIPPQLERSAAIDGAGTFATFRLIILPISAPPVFAVALFAFIEAWNEFFFAIILTGLRTKTAPIAIAEFAGQYQTLYGQMIASSVLASVPVVALAVIFRKYIIEGFVEGSVKG